MYEQSENIQEIAAALAAAQGKFDKVVKEADNPFFKSKYADLATLIEATRPYLSENGIALIQAPTFGVGEHGAYCRVITSLIHKSGQWIRQTLELPVSKMDAQGCGSASTYARRYAQQALLDVAGEDDDGNAASGKEEVEKEVKKQKEKPAAVPSNSVFSYHAGSGVLTCEPVDCQLKEAKGDKKPYYAVKLNQSIPNGKDMIFCWHKSMHEVLSTAKGKICKFVVSQDAKQFWSLDEVLEVDGKKFEPPPPTVAEQTWEALILESKTIEQFNTLPALVNGDVDRANVLSQAAADRGYTWNKATKQFEEHV